MELRMPTQIFSLPDTKPSWMGLTATILIVSMGLASCGKKDESPNPSAGMAMPVSVLAVKPTNVPITAEAVAQTEGAKEVEIRPRVGGILIKRLYVEGEPVKAGQEMFLIDPVPYQIALQQAKAAFEAQQSRVEQATREELRLKALLTGQSISQRDYDNALSEKTTSVALLQQALANVKAAELNLSYTKVLSPLTGVSGRFQLSEGALVSANTSLLTTVSQISPIWVRFSLSDSEIAELGGHVAGKNVKEVTLILPNGDEYKKKGALNFSASQIDPALGTEQLRAVFDNDDHQLLPGQFVRARITTGTRNGVFLVPQTSVLTGDQGKFVFVAESDKDGKVVAVVHPIKEGGWLGTDWVVLGGLKVGDKVITDNLIKIRPGALVQPNPLSAGSTNSNNQSTNVK